MKCFAILIPLVLLLTSIPPVLAVNHEEPPKIYIFTDYLTAAYYVAHLNSSFRVVLTDNPSETQMKLEGMGLKTDLFLEKKDCLLRKVNPRDLAYLLVYSNLTGDRSFITNETSLKRALSHMEGIVKQVSQRNASIAVLFFSSDGPEYSLLAAYASILRGAKLLDLDTLDVIPSSISDVKYLILITKPLTSRNYERYDAILKLATSVDRDPYLDVPLGVVTGPRIDTPFIMLLGPEVFQFVQRRRLRGISLVEDLPLTRKVQYIASSFGYDAEIIHPDVEYSNVTYVTAVSVLEGARGGIVYLNLHGNPYVMALKADGYPVLSSSSAGFAKAYGSIVLTLSCGTLKFSDLDNPSESVAYSILRAGAFAYIGARKVEFSIGSEAGTSYPDLILLMLFNGKSLGEAVMTVNNLHIREFQEEGISNVEAAYEILLGDPTLKIGRGAESFYEFRKVNGEYVVNIRSTTPTIYVRLNVSGNVTPDVEADLPSLFYKWYMDEKGLLLYISTLSSSYSGYFSEGSMVRIKLEAKHRYLEIVPYLAIFLVVVASLGTILRSRRGRG